jgi:hypothetical protein
MHIPLKNRIAAFFRRPTTQCAIAGIAAGMSWLIFPSADQKLLVSDYASIYGMLGVLSAVLALAGSFCIGHALQFGYAAAAERIQAYTTLHNRLDSLDDYLRLQDPKDALVDCTREFIWELSKLRLNDFPIRTPDWNKRLAKVTEELNQQRKRRPAYLWNDVTRALSRCEEAVSDLGLISIRQVVTDCILRPVIKMFFYLSLLLIISTALLIIPKISVHVVCSVISFFTVMTILLLAEVLWAVRRDFNERLDFVEDK